MANSSRRETHSDVQSKSRKRLIRRLLTGTTGVLVLGMTVSWVVASYLIAPQPQVIGDLPADLSGSSITLESTSGSTIAGWHIQASNSRGVVVLLHGMRGTRLSMLRRARLLHSTGFSIVMIDMQAVGESPGEQITLGYLEKHDAQAAVEFAKIQHPNEPIGVIGVSLGGAAAVLASPLGIDALVLESVYPTIDEAIHNRVAEQLGPFSTIPAEILLLQLGPRLRIARSDLRPVDHLPNVGCPVCMLSGTNDLHTTADETRRMFDVTREPKELWMVPGAAHVDLYDISPDLFEQRVLAFLNRHM